MSYDIYPIGIQTFEKIVKDGFVYVDKTDLISFFGNPRTDLFSEPSPTFRQEPAALYASCLFRREEGIVCWLENRCVGTRLARAPGVPF